MNLFKKGKTPTEPIPGHAYRGGCSAHEVRGPRRGSFAEASQDVAGHDQRMHGKTFNRNGYIEAVD